MKEMSETRTYQTSPKQLEAIAAQMKQHGFEFNPAQPQGSATAQGFGFSWNIAPSQDSVAITLQSHPWAMGGLFWKQIDSYLHSS
jgi:hypothetical protein